MRLAIISDIHSNLEALLSVVADIKKQNVDKIYCLGDVVGYGPFPSECLEIVKDFSEIVLKGNHEEGVVNSYYERSLNHNAVSGVRFSRNNLSDNQKQYLLNLPYFLVDYINNLSFIHGSLLDLWGYITTESRMKTEMNYCPTDFCFAGHIHVPFIYGTRTGFRAQLDKPIHILANQKVLINVGSVGQPRDGNPKACYGIFQKEKEKETLFILRRVDYSVKNTQKAILEKGLPKYLADRLSEGR